VARSHFTSSDPAGIRLWLQQKEAAGSTCTAASADDYYARSSDGAAKPAGNYNGANPFNYYNDSSGAKHARAETFSLQT
jgi:hypothetical protein